MVAFTLELQHALQAIGQLGKGAWLEAIGRGGAHVGGALASEGGVDPGVEGGYSLIGEPPCPPTTPRNPAPLSLGLDS